MMRIPTEFSMGVAVTSYVFTFVWESDEESNKNYIFISSW
jgi:hypothetical protein